jgi:O-antigen/teichoic acid export membrane protein
MSRALVKSTAVYGIADLTAKAIGFFAFPVYANILSVTQFGSLNLASTIAGLLGLFMSVGVNNAVQRYYYESRDLAEGRAKVVSNGLVILLFAALSGSVFFILGSLIFADWATEKFGLSSHVLHLVAFSCVMNMFLQYILDVIRMRFSASQFAFISLIKVILSFLITFNCIRYFNLGISSFFVGESIACLVSLPWALYSIRSDLTIAIEVKVVKKLFKFGFPFVFAGLAYWIFGSIDRWMLAELSSISEVGVYSAAFRFASILVFINSAFAQAWSPYVMHLRTSDSNYKQQVIKAAMPWFYGLLLISTMIALFADEILRVLLPQTYWAASGSLVFLVFGVALYGSTQITVIGISISERSKLIVWASWITALFNAALNYVLIPKYGSFGASGATFGSYLLLTLMYSYWSARFLPLPWPRPKLILLLFLSLFSVACSLMFSKIDWQPLFFPLKAILIAILFWSGFRFDFFKSEWIYEVLKWKAVKRNV